MTAAGVQSFEPHQLRVQGDRPPLADREQVNRLADRSVSWGFVAILGAVVVTPLFWVFRASLADRARGLRTVLDGGDLPKVLVTTVLLAIGSVAIAVVLGTTLAWFAYRLPPGRGWLGALPFMTLVIPTISLTSGWVFLLSPRIGYLNVFLRKVVVFYGPSEGPFDVYTLPWIIVLTGLSATAFVYVFVRGGLAQLHGELIDAAAASGADARRVMWHVVLPLVRPALVYGTATTFLLAVGQVTNPLLLGRRSNINVLSTEMAKFTSTSPVDYGAAATFGLPIVLLGIGLIAVQRLVLGDQSKYVTVGGKGSRPISRTGRLGQATLCLYGIVVVVLPLLALLYVSLSQFWTAELRLGGLSLETYRTVFDHSQSYRAIRNTIVFSMLAVVITLPVSHVCARLVYRRRTRPVVGSFVELIVALPLGIPGIIFGIGFLLAYTNAPFVDLGLYGKAWSMVLVYVTLMMPFAVRMQLSAMLNIGDDLANAGAVNGAGLWRRLLAIDIPLLRPALGATAALMIALISQEFSASLMVRSARTQVMSTALYDHWVFANYPQVAAIAMLMCLVTGLGVALAFALGGRSAVRGLGGTGG